MKLRPYQQTSIDNVLTEWKDKKSTLLVLPTGCGKTIVFCKLAEILIKNNRARILILAHRGELLEQAADKMYKATGLKCAIEKAEHTALGTFFRITVGSVQTLYREKRQKKFSKDFYTHIIIDEAHHAISSTYMSVLDYFDNARVLGVTATPDRGDKKTLSQVFNSIAFEYPLVEAIKSGYLSPIKALTVPLELNLNHCKIKAGDFSEKDVAEALDPYLFKIAEEMVKHCKDRKTIVFLPLIATSQKFQSILNDKGFRAGEVNGKSKDRAEVLQDFSDDKYNVLCNSMLLTEGYDEPSVDCVVVLRPTKVRALYSQMIGRGTRLSPETGKEELLVLDFLWHTEKHDLCRPADLISSDKFQAKAMVKKMEEDAKSGNPSMLDLEEVEQDTQKDAVEERESALAKQLKEQREKKARLVDPVTFGLSISPEDLRYYTPTEVHEMAPPTLKQIKLLEKHGIDGDQITNKGYASLLINKLIARDKSGMCTAKQIKFLSRYGFQNVQNWSLKQASSMFVRIKANRWSVPASVNPRTFNPEH